MSCITLHGGCSVIPHRRDDLREMRSRKVESFGEGTPWRVGGIPRGRSGRMAANDVLQLAVLMAVFAAGLQYMRSTPGGEDILQVCRRAILGLLIRAPADLPQDYVVLPKSDGVGNVAQPDAVRRAARTVDRTGHEMKCSEEIPAYSSVTTNNIQIFAQGFYKGRERGEHWWMYRIEFKNVGRQRVQLQARHWVFVDSNGKTVEVKGPGARGLTPKLGPDRRFQYVICTFSWRMHARHPNLSQNMHRHNEIVFA